MENAVTGDGNPGIASDETFSMMLLALRPLVTECVSYFSFVGSRCYY